MLLFQIDLFPKNSRFIISVYFSIYFLENKPSKNKSNVGFYSNYVTQLYRFILDLWDRFLVGLFSIVVDR